MRSHTHALGQCRRIVREHGWNAVVADDTAGAAREVAELGDPAVAALAPLLAAELYGLDVLAEDVEDEHHNTTRFLLLSREPREPALGDGPVITSFVFRVRNVPAALYKAMGGFATNGVNMTKLESYQLGGTFFATQFYADVEGHPKEASVALALEELAFFSASPADPRHLPGQPLPRRDRRAGREPDAASEGTVTRQPLPAGVRSSPWDRRRAPPTAPDPPGRPHRGRRPGAAEPVAGAPRLAAAGAALRRLRARPARAAGSGCSAGSC